MSSWMPYESVKVNMNVDADVLRANETGMVIVTQTEERPCQNQWQNAKRWIPCGWYGEMMMRPCSRCHLNSEKLGRGGRGRREG